MLTRLTIRNYALINKVDIDFNDGLSIITGETGAGKSIMLGALSMLLGSRADSKVIGASDKKSIVEAEFDISKYNLQSIFADNDIECNDNYLIIRREISNSGRSRAFINDSPVNIQLLREVALRLIDIHSQHQNQLLSDEKYQLNIIDSLAGNSKELIEYRQQFRKFVELRTLLNNKKVELSKNKENEEFIRFQLEQLQRLNPQLNEQDELERQFEILNNTESIQSELNEMMEILSYNDSSVLSQLSKLRTYLSEFNFELFNNNDAANIISRFDTSYIELKDISDTIGEYSSQINSDPKTLSRIDQRLNAIYDMNRRFNVTHEDKLVSIREELASKLESITTSDDDINELEQQVKEESRRLRDLANILTSIRENSARRFEEQLINIARPLGMPNIKFSVTINKGKLSIYGQDEIEFLCSFNKNQDLQAVSKVASGGEMSRIMLCIKAIIADKMQLPTIIFDEVDTGVSGDIANKMGEMMKRISEQLQIIAITHLPQVASKGSNHYRVFKEDTEETTITYIKRLTEAERVNELAQMLSGATIDDAAIRNAQSLLNQ